MDKITDININSDFLDFIQNHLTDDPIKLRLKKYDVSFDIKLAILQIECLQRIKNKLPSIYLAKNFIFPSILSTEQCSCEIIAQFHASLINECDNVLDMTAGLCIDSYYISKKTKSLTALEIDSEVASIAQLNMNKHASNMEVINCDCVKYIHDNDTFYSAIFIDPARRGENNKRLFALSDCNPDVIGLMETLNLRTNTLYIKASSMIDISASIKELKKCTDIWILSINNECKELLFKVDFSIKQTLSIPIIHTINFTKKDIQEYSFPFKQQAENYAVPKNGDFIYEPNASIMKSGCCSALCNRYDFTKLHPNTHLFICEKYFINFPGRIFTIREIILFKSKEIKNIKKKYPQINVSTRNFQLKAEELKNKLGVKDGGSQYLFGTTDIENKAILIICDKA